MVHFVIGQALYGISRYIETFCCCAKSAVQMMPGEWNARFLDALDYLFMRFASRDIAGSANPLKRGIL